MKRIVDRLHEPQVLFPLVAFVVLAVVWSTTAGLVGNARAAAERAGAVSSQELLGTYEAQVVRALGEINQTLNLVGFWHRSGVGAHRLSDLTANNLLPPELVFEVMVADRDGVVVESTGPDTGQRIADQDYFREQRTVQGMVIGHLPPGPTQDGKLNFSRRLETVTGEFDGVERPRHRLVEAL